MGFFVCRCERLIITELTNEYFPYFKECFEWLSLTWQFASITS